LRLAAAVIASLSLLAGAEVGAQSPPGVPVTQPGPLACETTNYRVAAITGSGGEFPIAGLECTGTHPGEACADYGYTINSKTNANVDHTVFAVSADQDLDATTPTAVVSGLGVGSNVANFLALAQHEYTVRFNSSQSKATEAHMFVLAPTAARTTTVLIRGGNKTESCRIAGPGVAFDPFKPQTATQDVVCAAGKCICHLTFDASGKIVSVTTDSPCSTAETDVSVTLTTPTGTVTETATFFEVITSGTGTCTTYPTKPKATTVCR
jgi:hypothetical protein